MKNTTGLLTSFLLVVCTILTFGQQIGIPRISSMPDKPSPYLMRDWKKVAVDFDQLVFDATRTGNLLPLSGIRSTPGTNYPAVLPIWMDTYVGQQNHTHVAEAINIIPAIVGASLVGIDKTSQSGINYVEKVKEFFNLKNGQKVYLNNYTGSTGNDWWYELMPNVFFYQLSALYPTADPEFTTQLITIADRQLDVLYGLGARLQPWTVASFNYRAFNLLTGLPVSGSVPEPESAGSVAWLLYQAYTVSGNHRYLYGAQLALDFLEQWVKNPSYELQLPYGIVAAARMNAVEGTSYDIDKMLNWTFSSGKGTLRNWGTIVGKWNGYDVAGLIGEANDSGNDYAFSMNGFQHAAALAPVVKYDKRYANAIGKWILNLANASRLFYANGLPDANQHPAGNAWAKQYDPHSAIPFEAIRQTAEGKSPYATGDAVRGGWAATDLSVYSGSSVGYLASIISPTNVEGILQIDLNKTDFRGENTYPVFLYYNPESVSQQVNLTLPAGNYDVYDAISETILSTNANGTIQVSIQPKSSRILVLIPPAKSKQTTGRFRKIYNGAVFDFHYRYNYTNPLRIKAFTSDITRVASAGKVRFTCLGGNITETARYRWFVNDSEATDVSGPEIEWIAPATPGRYRIKCELGSGYSTVMSPEIEILVAPAGEVIPEIENLSIGGTSPYPTGGTVPAEATVTTSTAKPEWSVSGGELYNSQGLTPEWKLPEKPGLYTLKLKVSNMLGSDSIVRTILVKELHTTDFQGEMLIYYPMNGATLNVAKNAYHAVAHTGTYVADQRGYSAHAIAFDGSGYLATANEPELNFTGKLTLALWINPDRLPGYEQYIVSHGSYEDRFKMSVTPDNKVRWTVRTSLGIADVDDDSPVKPGIYTHYCGVYTGYSLELYRNGKLVAFKPLSGQLGTTTRSITLARKDESETNYTFKGSIDEVRLYDAELPVNYIARLPSFWDLASGSNPQLQVLQPALFPNPVSSVSYLRIAELRKLNVYTVQGKKIEIPYSIDSDGAVIYGDQLPAGVYCIIAETTDGTACTVRFVKL